MFDAQHLEIDAGRRFNWLVYVRVTWLQLREKVFIGT
jgi:hypothetical protein